MANYNIKILFTVNSVKKAYSQGSCYSLKSLKSPRI